MRKETLKPFKEGWQQPTGEEVQELINLTQLTHKQVADLVGAGDARNVRRWVSYQQATSKATGTKIPYSIWAILCQVAGVGKIWTGQANESTQ